MVAPVRSSASHRVKSRSWREAAAPPISRRFDSVPRGTIVIKSPFISGLQVFPQCPLTSKMILDEEGHLIDVYGPRGVCPRFRDCNLDQSSPNSRLHR